MTDGRVLKVIMVRDTQLCEYTKSQRVVRFKWENCMAYELHLNKTLNKKTLSLLLRKC